VKRINRREFGLASSALAAAAAASSVDAAPAESSYTGALDGLESKVALPSFDPVQYTFDRYAHAPLALTYKPSSKKATEAWQKKLRAKVTELIGGFPKEKTPLQPLTLEVRDFPGYRREKFVMRTRPGMSLLGYLLTPREAKGPLPTMICVPGHGRGVDDIVGIDDKGRDRTDKAGYQHDFAIQTVEAGLAAVAIEPLAFGCRRDERTKKRGLGTSACQPAAGAALLLGETMIAWRSWDVVRTVDWIETRKDLDARRVGLMGISGGGTVTSFASALEPRIRAAMISGYLNTFKDSIVAMSHCIDNYVPGILNWCENYDVASLIAPRPLYVESGTRDNIFPIEASKSAFEKVRKVYEALGAAELVKQEVFEGEHLFHGGGGIPFLARHLKEVS
jgi:dienelactone hydrolase